MPLQIRKRLQQMRGFTMVELMIVIAIIGIIAVAVLSAINPVEQINKGRDTRTRSDASEMLNALERMYATDEAYPFYDPNLAINWAAGEVTLAADGTTAMDAQGIATALVTQSELKSGFETRVTAGDGRNEIRAYRGPNEDQLYICFLPSSNQFHREAVRKCTANTANYAAASADICGATAGDDGTELYCMP